MSKSICLDKNMVDAVRKMKKTDRFSARFGKTSLSAFVSSSIKSFLNKPSACFSCPHHKNQVAELELSRQKLAIKQVNAIKKCRREWVRCDPAMVLGAKTFAKYYGRSLREVVEQAVLEQLTRPQACTSCPLSGGFCEDIPSKQLAEPGAAGGSSKTTPSGT